MKNGGKRPGAGRKPDLTKQKAAEAYSKVLFEYIEKEAKPIAQAFIEKLKLGDIQAIKEMHDRLMGKAEQPITGKDGGPVQFAWLSQSPTTQESGREPSTPA